MKKLWNAFGLKFFLCLLMANVLNAVTKEVDAQIYVDSFNLSGGAIWRYGTDGLLSCTHHVDSAYVEFKEMEPGDWVAFGAEGGNMLISYDKVHWFSDLDFIYIDSEYYSRLIYTRFTTVFPGEFYNNLAFFYCSRYSYARIRARVNTVSSLSASAGGPVCDGNTINLTTNATTVDSYLWSGPSGFTSTEGMPNISGVTTAMAGIYSLTVVTTGGCTLTTTTNAVVYDPVVITGAGLLCAGTSVTWSGTPSGGTWQSFTSSVASAGSATGLITGIGTGTSVIKYTLPGTCNATKVVTVSTTATAGTISGVTTVCTAIPSILSSTISGGTWSSSDPSVASIGSTGAVTGILAGTAGITYTVTNSCGTASTGTVVSVNLSPDAGTLSGAATLCAGSSSSFSSTGADGVWSSSNDAVATVGTSGLVTGVTGGAAMISYGVTNDCGTVYASQGVTVNTLPAAGTISGASPVCPAATITLTPAISGGTWSSGSTAIATVGTDGVVTGVSDGTVIITYTLTNGCGSTATTTNITVSPSPDAGAITGTPTVCIGSTTTLSNSVTGGTWTSAATSIASVGATGIVSGIATGTALISYSVTNSCGTAVTTQVVSVNTTPTAGTITGPSVVGAGTTISLSNATTGGAWSSSATSIATVNTTGIVTGVAPGTTTISYTVTTACGTAITTKTVTVNISLPAITGSLSVCIGSTTALGNATLGGTWSSSNTSIASVTTTPGIVTGVSAGTATISYTLLGVSITADVTVNAAPDPGSVSGTASMCTGATGTVTNSVSGGTWSSSNTTVASVNSSGLVSGVSAGTAAISYTVTGTCGSRWAVKIITVFPLPAPISGTATLCEGSTTGLSCSPGGGTWTSSDALVATISSTGVVTGTGGGTATISYTRSTGCASERVVTVFALPGSISGSLSGCIGTASSLSSATSGGVWTSSSTYVATVGYATGVLTGAHAGTARITYTVAGGCRTISVATVNNAPGALSGLSSLCSGGTLTLSSATWSGAWSSSDGAVASAATLSITQGLITGLSAGTTTISYTVGSCSATKVVTVNAAGGAIAGDAVVCVGQTNATLTSGLTGGTWSSSASAIAGVHAATGLITGNSIGTATITYTSSPGCFITAVATVNATVNTIAGASSVILGNTVNLTNATPGGTWTSGNTYKATIDAGTGVLTGVAAGTTMITYLVTTGCYTTRPQTVTYSRPGAPAAVANTGLFSVFPNPSPGTLTIAASVNGIFILYTIDGKEVKQYVVTDARTSIKLPNDLSAGMYVCRFNGEDGSTEMVRLVLQK